MLTRMARQWSSVEEARKSRVIVRRNLKHGGGDFIEKSIASNGL